MEKKDRVSSGPSGDVLLSRMDRVSSGSSGDVLLSRMDRVSSGPSGDVLLSRMDRVSSGPSGDVLLSRMDRVSSGPSGDVLLSRMDRVSSGPSGDVLLSRMALNDNKAGMEGLDRDKINKIILEASKGSRFYENEQKKEQQVNQRIERMMQQKDTITHTQLEKAHTEVERLRAALERGRDLSRVMVHVDMDAFYAAVEMRDNPELKDKPMAVGSSSMLSTSNYHARKFGVRAAMPGFIARKLCPNLVIVPTNFDQYRAVSSEIREIFADYDPHFQPLSLDEAYLDLTDHLEQRVRWPESLRTHCLRAHQGEVQSEPGQETAELSPLLFDDTDSDGPTPSGGSAPGFQVFGTSAEEAVREMRFRIEQKTSLTASAGIAPNMLLAKVCSDLNKPNGQYLLSAHTHCVMDFIEKLPVRKVFGVGKVSEKMLGALGITSCAHLGQQMALLSLLFSETAWHHFLRISLGLGATHLERDGERKSMSTERTFREMNRAEDQVSLVRELCEDLSNDLKREGLKGKTVTLKLKNVQFEVRTRACSLPCAVWTAPEIYSVANQLLRTEMDSVRPLPLRLRLMGVRISSFISSDDKAPQQRSIMGFLQQGRTDPPPPPQVSSQTCGKGSSNQKPSPPAEPACAQLPSGQLQHPGQPPGHPLGLGHPPGHNRGPQHPLGPGHPPGHNLGPQHPLGPGHPPGHNLGPQHPLGPGHPPGHNLDPGHPPGPEGHPLGPGQQQQSSGPEVQRSFFQRAYAQRLRLQAEEEDAASSSPTDTHTEKIWDKDMKETHMKETHMKETDMKETDMKETDMKETHIKETDSSSSSVVSNKDPSSPPQASTSGCRDTLRPLEGLTCPVCFREVHTSDLDVFNRHIDLCLSGGACPSPPPTSTTTDLGVAGGGWEEWEEEREEFETEEEQGKGGDLGRRRNDSCVTETTETLLRSTANWPVSVERSEDESSEPRSQTNHDGFKRLRGGGARLGGDSPQGASGTTAMTSSQQGAESQRLGPAPLLTCPVCQVTQATGDLAVFNRHIDLCLNQEVLHQLKGQRSVTSSSASPTERTVGLQGEKVKERGEPQPATSKKHKGKRQHSPQSSPAKKKTKALTPAHPLNTIDRFFR